MPSIGRKPPLRLYAPLGAIQDALPSTLSVCDKSHIGLHYAKTLDVWFK